MPVGSFSSVSIKFSELQKGLLPTKADNNIVNPVGIKPNNNYNHQ